MCGIFGEYVWGQRSLLSSEAFESLNALNFLRGPDSGGYWSDGRNVQLGFRRLAIMDLSAAANQPMTDAHGHWALVFNGEVYNHQEIRKKLPEGKYRFKTHSDTETILHALDHFGPEKTAEMLDGMFAIAAYHRPSGELYLMRDFAGIKPLFIGMRDGVLVFGSQFNQISQHPVFCNARVKEDVLRTYLQYHYIPAPLGLLEDTFQLRPGELLHIKPDGSIIKRSFWNYPEYQKPDLFDEKEALDFLERILDEAVTSEMESDVPLGTFLSGGIDSPLVAWFASRKAGSALKAYSIGSDSAMHDESEDAKFFASKIGVQHHLEKMDAAYALSRLDKVMDGLKEPLADFSVIPTYLVCEFARKDLTVALSGDGGDELFFGYERFYSVLKNLPYKNLSAWSRKAIYGYEKWIGKSGRVNDIILSNDFAKSHQLLHSRCQDSLLFKLAPQLMQTELPIEFDAYHYEVNQDLGQMLHRMARAEFYGMMQKTLAKVDRMSMANSLEVRVPFLMKSFIEQSLRFNPLLSYGPGKKKELLKKLLKSKTGLPQGTDKKRGFTVPLGKWIREDLKTPFEETLLDSSFLQTFGLKESGVLELLHSHQQGTSDHKWPLFTLYGLARWNQQRKSIQ